MVLHKLLAPISLSPVVKSTEPPPPELSIALIISSYLVAMSTPKPTLFLVPGAWHPNTCFAPLSAQLTAAGFPIHLASLASLNPISPATNATCSADVLALQAQLLPIIDKGIEVVVVCHSYGGIPGGGAAAGLSKKDRAARNEKGGVLGLIYLTSFVVPEGVSLVQFLGGQHAPYVQQNQVCS